MKIYIAAPPSRPSKIKLQKFMKLLKVETLWSYIYIVTEKSTRDRFEEQIK